MSHRHGPGRGPRPGAPRRQQQQQLQQGQRWDCQQQVVQRSTEQELTITGACPRHDDTEVNPSTCRRINQQIIAASAAGALQPLVSIIEVYFPYMNLVNLTTSLHRLAKIHGTCRFSQLAIDEHSIWQRLLDAIHVALCGITDTDAGLPQTLGNIAWSLANLRIPDLRILRQSVPLALATMRHFKPFEVSSLLWAFAKLGTGDNMVESAKVLFDASASHIMDNLRQFSFRSLATIIWAFATAKQHAARLFAIIAAQMCRTVQSANSQEIANTAWAFGTLNFRHNQLQLCLAEMALVRLVEFKPQEISNMLWGFATNDFFHEALFQEASTTVQCMELQPQHLANILWSFARLKPCHPSTRATGLALLPCCTASLKAFKPQEVSSVLSSAGKIFGRSSEGVRATCAAQPCNWLHPHVLSFLSAAVPWTVAHVCRLSDQSLANAVSAFVLLGLGNDESLIAVLEKEALKRTDVLQPSALIIFLKAFLDVPTLGRRIVCTVAGRLAWSLSSLQPQDLRALARMCSASLNLPNGREPTLDELDAWCIQLSRQHVQGPWADAEASGSSEVYRGVSKLIPGKADIGGTNIEKVQFMSTPTAKIAFRVSEPGRERTSRCRSKHEEFDIDADCDAQRQGFDQQSTREHVSGIGTVEVELNMTTAQLHTSTNFSKQLLQFGADESPEQIANGSSGCVDTKHLEAEPPPSTDAQQPIYIVKNTFIEADDADTEVAKRRIWASTFSSEKTTSRMGSSLQHDFSSESVHVSNPLLQAGGSQEQCSYIGDSLLGLLRGSLHRPSKKPLSQDTGLDHATPMDSSCPTNPLTVPKLFSQRPPGLLKASFLKDESEDDETSVGDGLSTLMSSSFPTRYGSIWSSSR